MATSIFNKRTDASYGTALTTYAASEWDQETKVIYLLGRNPNVHYDKCSNPESPNNETFQQFLKDQGIETPSKDVVAEAAAIELSNRIVTDGLIDQISQNIVEQLKSNQHKAIDKIKVICPFPIDPNETSNEFAPALNALVTHSLQKRLPQILEKNGLPNLPIINEHDPSIADPETSILNVVNNRRGSTSNPEPGKEGLMYVERLVRQPVYTGEVDRNALYVPVDDFLVSQSTLSGLMSFIQSHGGITTNAVTGCQLFNGINVMDVQPETLEYLNTVIDDVSDETLEKYGDIESYEASVKQLMSKLGLEIDFENPEGNTISNAEMMFLAGIMADPQNPNHVAAFENMLSAIGSTPEEAKGNSPSDVFHAAPMSLEDLERHFSNVLEARKPLVDMDHSRINKLSSEKLIADFEMET